MSFRCSKCKKFIAFSIQYDMGHGNFFCDSCYKDYLHNEWTKKCEGIAEKILKYQTSKIVINFIEKYGINPSVEHQNKLIELLEKNYNFTLNSKDFKYVLSFVKQKHEKALELEKFENELKYHNEKNFKCSVCNKEISRNKFEYSIDVFGKALCMEHQAEAKATLNAKKLYNALVKRKLNCKLEASDGHKSVDIAIPDSKIYIEIDGKQHSINPKQSLADMKRDTYSHKDGFYTKRISNDLIKKHLDEVADSIVVLAKERNKELNKN